MDRSMEILLVEDNPADVRLMQEALRETRVGNTLRVAADGIEAMAYLRHEGGYANMPRPDIVLLDLNLPRKNGHEVLAEIKSDPMLKCIPVVIMTTSSSSEDICRSYDLQANCHITKPADIDRFIGAVGILGEHWLKVASLPGNCAGVVA
jgi:Response regulators consisting of a CheY-like receiver domain and a winged-helix DNA-binding domain